MEELEEKIKLFLINKINSGEEKELTISEVNGLRIQISLDEKLFISSNVTTKISDQTFKELFALYRTY